MRKNRRTLYILLPIIVLAMVGSTLIGFGCTPSGTMPSACQQWYDKGKMDGYNAGYSQGKTDGQSVGYSEGYTKGLQDGKSLCPQCPTCPTCPQQQQYPYYYPYPRYYYWGY